MLCQEGCEGCTIRRSRRFREILEGFGSRREDNRGSANSEIGNSSRRISKAEGTKGILNIARYVKSPIKPDVKIAELVGTRRELVNLRTV